MTRLFGGPTAVSVWLAVLSGAVITVYAGALKNPFLYDDQHAIVMNEFIRGPQYIGGFFSGQGISSGAFPTVFRPLTFMSFLLNYQVGGLSPFGYRLVNLGLHLIVVLVAFFVIARLLRAFSLGPNSALHRDDARLGALAAVTFFALHPIHSAPMVLAWKRTTLLASLFFLLALWAFLHLRGVGGPPQRGASHRAACVAAVWMCFFLSLASKETALTLPPVLLALELWPGARSTNETARRPWARAVLLHAPLWAGVVLALTVLYPTETADGVNTDRWAYLFAQAKVIWLYVAMILSPGLVSAAYDVTPVTTLVDPLAIVGGLAIIALLAASLRFARRYPLPAFAILWALITLAPTSSVHPNAILVDEDRVHLPFLLVWAIVGAWLAIVLRRGRLARICVAVFVFVLATSFAFASAARTFAWRDDLAVWRDALDKYPNSAIAQTNQCTTLAGRVDLAELAVATCRATWTGAGRNSVVAVALTTALLHVKRGAEAKAAADFAVALFPRTPEVFVAAGHVAWFLEDRVAAVRYYREALSRTPWNLEARLYLAKNLAELGRKDEAREIAAVLATRPLSSFAMRATFAELLADLGDPTGALSHLDPLIAERPDDLWFRLVRARALLAAGRKSLACVEFSTLSRRIVSKEAAVMRTLEHLKQACR